MHSLGGSLAREVANDILSRQFYHVCYLYILCSSPNIIFVEFKKGTNFVQLVRACNFVCQSHFINIEEHGQLYIGPGKEPHMYIVISLMYIHIYNPVGGVCSITWALNVTRNF